LVSSIVNLACVFSMYFSALPVYKKKIKILHWQWRLTLESLTLFKLDAPPCREILHFDNRCK